MNNTHQQPHTADAGTAYATSSPAYQQIKLALDVHAATIVVVRMLDGAKPQPSQTIRNRRQPTGRGRQASANSRPVSLVPINLGV